MQAQLGKLLSPLALENALAAAVSATHPPPEPWDEERTNTSAANMSGNCADFVVELDTGGQGIVGAVVTREDLTSGQRILSYGIDYMSEQGEWVAFPECSSSGFESMQEAATATARNGMDGRRWGAGAGEGRDEWDEEVVREDAAAGQNYTLKMNANNVYGEAKSRGNTSSITFAGVLPSYQDCQGKCSLASTCLSFAWVGATGDQWEHQCFLRNDTKWEPREQQQHVSGYKGSPLTEFCVHAQSVGALLVDTLPPTRASKVRFRCESSVEDPVALRSVSAHEFSPPRA